MRGVGRRAVRALEVVGDMLVVWVCWGGERVEALGVEPLRRVAEEGGMRAMSSQKAFGWFIEFGKLRYKFCQPWCERLGLWKMLVRGNTRKCQGSSD